jgi:carbon storage regulator
VLILTRRVGQSVVIGDDIVVTVVEVRGDSVRIGIDAPRSVNVHREEVYRELQSANEQAASPDAGAVEALRDLVTRAAPPAEDGRPPEGESGLD